jgi:hypothetical protein
MTQQRCLSQSYKLGSAMRGVSKKNAIKRARIKNIKIATIQNKSFASKWPKMTDIGLATKAKLKGSQVQN